MINMPSFIITLTAVFCMLLQTAAFGGKDNDIRKVHFAEESNWPPFTTDKFGMATEGLSLRLMKEIFSRLHVDVDVELLPQKRMLEYLRQGKKDGATVISINKARREFMDFSEPLFPKRGFVYYLAGRKPPIIWDDFADLKGLRIGLTSGHNYGDEFEQAVTRHGLNVLRLSKTRQGFDMLLAGRIDAFLCFEMTARLLIRDPKYKGKIVNAAKSYYSEDYHIGFAKKSRAKILVPEVDKIIRQMKEDGSLQKIISEYMD